MKKASAASPEPSTSSSKKRLPVPMLDLARQYDALRKQVTEAILRVCESQHYIMGEDVDAFEQEAAEFLGTKFAIGCASGTDAIWLSLLAAGINPSDEVI